MRRFLITYWEETYPRGIRVRRTHGMTIYDALLNSGDISYERIIRIEEVTEADYGHQW